MPAKQADTSLCFAEWAGAVAAGGGGCPASSWRSSGGESREVLKGQYSFGIVGRALEQLFKLRNRFKPTADVHEKLTDDLTRQSRRCSR